MSEDLAIKVDGLSKSFKLPHEKQSSVKGLFVSGFRGKRSFQKQTVLDNISFGIKKGEFFGIVGRNGSGKSTLLKILAGIYHPDKGNILVNGSLVPFIELGVGFSPDLTGRENVFLNGALLGFSRKEMLSMYDEIVEFAELEKFMDQKLKNYSSGMQVRLAFSIAIRAKSDILVLDEVLAVGDANFQKKCFNYFEELKRDKKTVVLVTHDMSSVVNYCNRALIIDDGIVSSIGKSDKIAQKYYKANVSGQRDSEKRIFYDKNYKIVTAELIDNIGHKTDTLEPHKKFIIRVIVESKTDTDNLGIGFSIKNSGGVAVVGYNTYIDNKEDVNMLRKKGIHTIEYEFTNILKNGIYSLNIGIHRDVVSSDGTYHLDPLTVEDGVIDIISGGWGLPSALVDLRAKTRIIK